MDIQEPDPSKFESNNADHCKQKGSSLLAGESIVADEEKIELQLKVIQKIYDSEIISPYIAGKGKIGHISNKMWKEKIRVKEREEKKRKLSQVSKVLQNNRIVHKKKYISYKIYKVLYFTSNSRTKKKSLQVT